MREHSVTILVTAKNSMDTIKKCVDSLLKLHYSNYKIFITDGYSTDGTWGILQNYSTRIKLERFKGNIATCHNYMIKKSDTKFVAFTDADCVVEKDWLKNLISGFKSGDIVATAGYCSTPENANKLQKLVGKELENRFKSFPEYISRAPTMNLCVRTDIAKKNLFDEKFDVAQETDWGYKLQKFGKMAYVPNAVIWHYHRATLKEFFKQQFKYAKFAPLLYIKHKEKSAGNHITTPDMILGEFVFSFACLFGFLSIFSNIFIAPASALVFFLLFLYVHSITKITKDIKDVLLFLAIYIVRTTAWTFGLLVGIFNLVRGKYR